MGNIVKDFRSLKVWEKSHRLVLAIYAASRSFPPEERYGLTSQIRRASASIPANIAEGCGRGSEAEFARFLQIARGSASELEYHLLLARDLALLATEHHAELERETTDLKKMLTALLARLTVNRIAAGGSGALPG